MSIPVFQLSSHHVGLIFGLGLIGRTIFSALKKKNTSLHLVTTKIDWRDSNSLISIIETIFSNYESCAFDIIWSAGKAGFSATNDEMEIEYKVYVETIKYLANHRDKVRFNFLSSAGGIYENACYVDDIESIAPARPYGFWKLKQENILHQLNVSSRIYRIASVYGMGLGNNRAGLINVMINQVISNQPVIVYGNQNTLRDYILNSDIGNYIVNDIITKADSATKIVASGRASSINELINIVSRVAGKKVKAYYIDSNNNSNNIIFSPQVVSKNISTTSIEEGIGLLYRKIRTG